MRVALVVCAVVGTVASGASGRVSIEARRRFGNRRPVTKTVSIKPPEKTRKR